MWIYHQRSGNIVDRDGVTIARGYSGHGSGKNNPDMQSIHSVGPLPRGFYKMESPFDSPTHGKFCIRLIPFPETETFGRDGFLWHGDSIQDPGNASLGCICSAPQARHRAWDSGDHILDVQI